MHTKTTRLRARSRLLAACAAAALVAAPIGAIAAPVQESAAIAFTLPSQPLDDALMAFARIADVQVLYDPAQVRGKVSSRLDGRLTPTEGLRRLLTGTGLRAQATGSGTFTLVQDQADGGENAARLEEVIVTATRRAQSAIDVPASVAAYSREQMDLAGVRNFADLAAQTPGVRLREEQNQIAIRGLASNAGSASTGVYLDETPIQVRTFGEGMASALPYVFDLERVEILRGPQGTLFGAGSLGGTIRYITTQPSTTKTSGYGRAELATTENGGNSYEAGVAYGAPIIDGVLGFRVGASHRRSGGWVDRVDYHDGRVTEADANWTENSVVRAALVWRPNHRLTITPSIQHETRWVNDTSDLWESFTDVGEGRFANGNPVQLTDDDDFTLGSLTLEYEGDGFDVISSTSWFDREQRRHYDNSIYNLASYDWDTPAQLLLPTGPNYQFLGIYDYRSVGQVDNGQTVTTQEIRAQSSNPDARLQWTAGVFYSKLDMSNSDMTIDPYLNDLYQLLYGSPAGLGPDNIAWLGVARQVEEQLAGFVDATLSITDRLRVSGGLRASKVDFSNESSTSWIGDVATASQTSQDDPVTPRFQVAYDLNEDIQIYAGASKGYRTGGSNAQLSDRCLANLTAAGEVAPPIDFSSDHAWSYEAGAKGYVFDSLRFEASVFHVTWSDIQQRVTLGPCGVTYTVNLGEAASTGFDLALSYRPVPNLLLEAAVGYADARFTSDIYEVRGATSGRLAVRDGNAIWNAGMPWQANVSARYDLTLFDRPAFIRGSWEYSSENDRLRTQQDPGVVGYDPTIPDRPATHFVRARAGVEVRDGLQLQAFIDNLFGSDDYLLRMRASTSGFFYTNRTFRPRTLGVTLVQDF